MKWAVISDEVTAVGWRLAGARVHIADEKSIEERFRAVRRSVDFLLITAELAARLPPALREQVLSEEKPLVALIADAPSGGEPPDLEREMKHALGIAI